MRERRSAGLPPDSSRPAPWSPQALQGAGLGALLVGLAAIAASGHFSTSLALLAGCVWLLSLPGRASIGVGTVLVVALALRAVFGLGSDFFSNDLYRYLWEGGIQLHGHSPYALAPLDEALAPLRDDRFDSVAYPELPTVYPPLAQWVFAIAAAAGLDELGFRNAMLLLDAGLVLALVGWLRATGRPVGHAVLYAWSPVALASSVGGHIDPLMCGCLVGMAWAWERGRAAAAAVWLGLAILAKSVAVLLVPWLLLRRRAWVLAGVLPVVALGYAPYLLAEPGSVLGSLGTFGTEFAFHGALFPWLERLSFEAAPLVAAALLCAATAGVALFEPRIARAGALVFASLLLLSPTVHVWYLTWFLVMLPGWPSLRALHPLPVWAVAAAFCVPAYLAFAGVAPEEPPAWLSLATYLPVLVCAGLALRGLAGERHRLGSGSTRLHTGPSSSRAERRVGVVIPARNEAANLERLLPSLDRRDVARIVVADSPTGDDTPALCRRFEAVDYLPVERRGYGAAVQAGIEHLGDCDVAVVCDADDLGAPRELDALLAPLDDEAVGLVTAARTDPRATTPLQRLGNHLVCGLIGLGWGRRFHDLGPLRAIRLDTFRSLGLEDRAFGWNVEMNVRALQRGSEVVEIAVSGSSRQHGESVISGSLVGAARAGAGMLGRLFRLREEACPRPSSS